LEDIKEELKEKFQSSSVKRAEAIVTKFGPRAVVCPGRFLLTTQKTRTDQARSTSQLDVSPNEVGSSS
jgi:hypothetical protein